MSTQEMINKFKFLVASGNLVEARQFYEEAESYADENMPLGAFGSQAVAIATANRFALPDHNVAWPSDFEFASEADSRPSTWVQ